MPWKKTDIINHLAAAGGYHSYLEICTTKTGNDYQEIDRSKFPTCHRLMFRCPDGFSDGLAVDFAVAGLDISQCVRQIKERHHSYDVILVDPWHEYEPSYRALEAALDLVAERGMIIVHDCLPPTPKHASPDYAPGPWCGVTYKAYLDFVLTREDIAYFTIDADFGCGVIRKVGLRTDTLSALDSIGAGRVNAQDRTALIGKWTNLGDDFDASYRLLHDHKRELLNLVSVRQFLRRSGGLTVRALLRRIFRARRHRAPGGSSTT